MPTGVAHHQFVNEIVNGEVVDQESFPCRCTIGDDHLDVSSSWGDEPDEEDEDGTGFAGDEEIWLSSGMDEDYDFRPVKDR
jgi:hypothetical protein